MQLFFFFIVFLVRHAASAPRQTVVHSQDKPLRGGSEAANHVCEIPEGQEKVKRNDFHYRGAALGGHFVLEPWITPSLFYQFLGASQKWGDSAPQHVGLDSFSFCTALGPVEANKQLKRHWKAWVTEQQIIDLKALGADTVRIPVGDWMYVPYGPYIGCYDGALEELDRVLRLCEKYGVQVLLDIHAMRGSQNGLDNSGTTGNMDWTYKVSDGGYTKYLHWDIRGGDWIGHYNQSTKEYDSINMTNINHSLNVVEILVDLHKNDPIVIGLEPLNEPWEYTPLDALKDFYWASYQIVQRDVPHWVTVFHDSFRLSFDVWGKFMVDCPNYALDTHIYQAWFEAAKPTMFQEQACEAGQNLRLFEEAGIPIIVGEWSLATDNCAMWLNGLNNNVPGYPKVVCDMVKCPNPYMGLEQPGAPPDERENLQDPFGSGNILFLLLWLWLWLLLLLLMLLLMTFSCSC
jgi:glucan 1,3-beta-glucosidase